MQARAIFQAAVSMNNHGIKVVPEIMVPLVGTPQELGNQVSLIRSVAKKVFSEMGTSLSYKVGTMIEIPRAALIADEIAKEAEFFSFGTNDLLWASFYLFTSPKAFFKVIHSRVPIARLAVAQVAV